MTEPTPRGPRNATDRDDLVDRGPVETLAPSRTAMVLVGAAGLVLAVLAGLGIVNASGGADLDESEELLRDGEHELVAGPARVTTPLPGEWVRRQRCDRWTQVSTAADDATTVHVVWLDAVPEPSTVDDVQLVAPPADLAAWWRDELDLRVTPVETTTLDGRPVEVYDLDATADARRRDGLFACGDLGGPAGVGMFGSAARFDQRVAVVDADGTRLLVVAAAFTGGDIDEAVQGLEAVLSDGTLAVADE